MMGIYEDKKRETLADLGLALHRIKGLYGKTEGVGEIAAMIFTSMLKVEYYWHPERLPITVEDVVKEGDHDNQGA